MAPKSRKKKANARVLQCYCENHCPGNVQNGTCETRPGGSCFASVEEVMDEETKQLVPEWSHGCMSPEQGGGLLQCKVGTMSPQIHGKSIVCCDNKDMCNRDLHLEYNPRTTTTPDPPKLDANSAHQIALLTSVIICSTVFLVVVCIVYCVYRRREKRKPAYLMNSLFSDEK